VSEPVKFVDTPEAKVDESRLERMKREQKERRAAAEKILNKQEFRRKR